MDSISKYLDSTKQSIIRNEKLTEIEATRLAFAEAVKRGYLINFYECAFAKGCKSQLFMFATANNGSPKPMTYTYFNAIRYNSDYDILISEYSELRDRVLRNLRVRADVPPALHGSIVKALDSFYKLKCLDYIEQFKTKMESKARRLGLASGAEQFNYYRQCYDKLCGLFIRLNIKDFDVTMFSLVNDDNQFHMQFTILDDPAAYIHHYKLADGECIYKNTVKPL